MEKDKFIPYQVDAVVRRPVIVGTRNGFFHIWGHYSDRDGESTMGIVEFEDGSCDYFMPQDIKFIG